MMDNARLVFAHGLYGSSQGFKATLLRKLFPGMLTPDFNGSLEERLSQLDALLANHTDWTIIGSSFGGLMGALYTCHNPHRVKRLILLAPALIWPDLASSPPDPVPVKTIIYHGQHDELIPVDAVQSLAECIFENLTFNIVDDDHSLHKTVKSMDWLAILGDP